MKLTNKQDIMAPAEDVFALLSDPEVLERAATRRGAEVERIDDLGAFAPGMGWRLSFAFRGRWRSGTVRVSEYEPPSRLGFDAKSNSYEGSLAIEVLRMSARRSRVHFVIEVKPLTLPARLMLQSLRLGRNRIERRIDRKAAQFVGAIEARLRKA